MSQPDFLCPADADPRERAIWHDTNSWRDYGDAMARWLLGSLAYQPFHQSDGPEPETRAVATELAAINRAGFVTHDSQAGAREDEDGWVQRAYVVGLCEEVTATRIRTALASSDLVTMWCSPDRLGDAQIVVTRQGTEEATWLGVLGDLNDDTERTIERAGPGIARLHLFAWELAIFDPVWGRNDLLWPSLLEAVGGAPDVDA